MKTSIKISHKVKKCKSQVPENSKPKIFYGIYRSGKRVLRASVLLLVVSSFFLSPCHSQNNPGSHSWLPRTLSVDLSADGRLGLGKKQPGFGIGQIRLIITLTLRKNVEIVAFVKSDVGTGTKWYEFVKRKTSISQVYLQYHDYFKIFSGNLSLNANLGKLEWYPSYTDALQITENIDAYFNPPAFYGTNINLDYSFAFAKNLSAHIGGWAGKVIKKDFDISVSDAYVRYNPEFLKDFGLSFQAGKSAGTKYFVNETFLYYRPVLYKAVRLDIRAGKLTGIDKSPYGIRIGGDINLKYVSLGAYYEYRFNQLKEERNMVFYWSITGPEGLAKFLNTYQLIFDLNTNSILFNIPFLKINFL